MTKYIILLIVPLKRKIIKQCGSTLYLIFLC